MQTKRERKMKLNNKGLTLVEVVVAVTMLTIVVAAMMSVMVASARYNARADAVHQASIAAESIMEKFKAYDVEELCEQFHAGSFKGATVAPSGGMTVYGKTVAGGTADFDPYSSGSFEKSPSGEYLFSLLKLQTETAQYNATINVTPYEIKDGVNFVKKQSVVDMTQIHPYKDAIYRSSVVHDTGAINQIENKFQSDVRADIVAELNGDAYTAGKDKKKNDYTVLDIVNSYIKITRRETNLDIAKDHSTGGHTTVVMTMRYYFIVDEYPYHLDTDTLGSPTGTGLDFPTDGSEYYVDVILDIPTGINDLEIYNSQTDAGLDRIFFYYYPVYEATYTVTNPGFKDVINVTTSGFNADEYVELYILKQVREGADMVLLNLAERNYYPKVTGSSDVKLIHNFRSNIGGTSTPAGANMSGFYSEADFMDASLMEKDFCLMYKMELVVTDVNTGNVVTKLQGTKNY